MGNKPLPISSNNGNGESRSKKFFSDDLPRYFLLIATLLIFVVFGIIEPKMFRLNNILTIFCTTTLVGTMAFAVVLAMASGEMNMAVGAQATLSATVVGAIMGLKAFDSRGTTILVYLGAIVLGIIISLLIGAGGIWLTLRFSVPSFITTLGFSNVAVGLQRLLSNNKAMFNRNWDEVFKYLGQGFIGKVPVLFFVFALLIILLWILVDKTKLGSHIFSVGASRTATTQVGINTKKIKITAMLLSSAVAGIGGILAVSRAAQVQPTLGSSMLLDAIAAAMLGATFLRPGRFNVQGTVIAAILTTVIQNGIYTIGAPYEWKLIIQGLIFLFAVGFIAKTRKEGLPGVRFG